MHGLVEAAMRVAHVPFGAPVAFEFLREQLAVEPIGAASTAAPNLPVPVLNMRAPHLHGHSAPDIRRQFRLLVHLPVQLGLITNRSDFGLLYRCLRIRLFQKADRYASLFYASLFSEPSTNLFLDNSIFVY